MSTEINTRRAMIAIALCALCAALAAPGCMWAPHLAKLRKDIERQIPGASFDREFEISLGPLSLGFARMVTGFIPDAREARGYLQDVRKIEVAVYNTSSLPPVNNVRMPNRLMELEQKDGWETAVRVREEDQVVWVMYRAEGDRVKDMYVVVLGDDELVMVRAEGRLERLFGRALAESHGAPGIPRLSAGDS